MAALSAEQALSAPVGRRQSVPRAHLSTVLHAWVQPTSVDQYSCDAPSMPYQGRCSPLHGAHAAEQSSILGSTPDYAWCATRTG